MPNVTEPARRIIPIRILGLAQTLTNNASNAVVTIPPSVNAFYVGSACNITFDGVAASATNGIAVTTSQNLTEPICIPQGAPNLNIYGVGAATYIQFCQCSGEC